MWGDLVPDAAGETEGDFTGCKRPSEIKWSAQHEGGKSSTWVPALTLTCLVTQSKGLNFSGPEFAHLLPDCLRLLGASSETPE